MIDRSELQVIAGTDPVGDGDLLSHPLEAPSIIDELRAVRVELAALRGVLTELTDMAKRHPFLSKFLK